MQRKSAHMLVSKRFTSLLAAFAWCLSARLAAQAPGQRFAETIPGSDLSFVMVFAPGGSFRIGSPDAEAGRDADEGPVRAVVLSPFWIGSHEVTQDEYAIFRQIRVDSAVAAAERERLSVDGITRPTPPYEDPAHGMGGGDHPATGMTQWAALQYARWLSEMTGRLYRLPTEAEWEFACRAGGGDAGPLAEHAWYSANGEDRLHPVGTKAPNGWGLQDMLGNAAEWTLDQYDSTFYSSLSDGAVNPWARPTREHPRTVRGGSFEDDEEALRCADRRPSTLRWKRRDPQLPKSKWWNTDSPHVGFRLVSPAETYTIEEIRAYWAAMGEVN